MRRQLTLGQLKRLRFHVILIALVVGGVLLTLITRAATSTTATEAENGTLVGNVARFSDELASNGLGVRFGASPGFLDVTTSYPAPSTNVKFVAPDGQNSNTGTLASPYGTICHALSQVSAGGTIVLRGGTYHEGWDGVSITSGCHKYLVGKQITIQSYQTERAWVKGSKVVTNWSSDGQGNYKTSWPALANLAKQAVANDNSLSEQVVNSGSSAADAAMVFVDDVPLKQVDTLAEVAPNTFFADRATNTVYIKNNPVNQTVEVTDSVRFFEFLTAGSVIKGVGFAQYATTWDPGVTPGAVVVSAPNMRFENTVFTHNAAAGLDVLGANTVVSGSVLSSNGAQGLVGNRADGSIIEDSVIAGNNAEDFSISSCGGSCTMAGAKIARSVNLQIKGNIFENNNGAGFWCDLNCVNSTIVKNVMRSNKQSGLFYEVSSGGIIASNLIVGNQGADDWDAGLRISADNVKIYNNTIANNHTNLYVYDDERTSTTDPDIGPDTRSLTFKNNILSGGSIVFTARWASAGGQTGPEDYFSGLDYNAYYRKNAMPTTLIEWGAKNSTNVSRYNSLNMFQAAKSWEDHGIDENGAAHPFFADEVAGNYRVFDGSSAKNSGETLPADVASALGVTAASPDRGALLWPGR